MLDHGWTCSPREGAGGKARGYTFKGRTSYGQVNGVPCPMGVCLGPACVRRGQTQKESGSRDKWAKAEIRRFRRGAPFVTVKFSAPPGPHPQPRARWPVSIRLFLAKFL
ncbi:hypothetical protein AAFF_G00227080 [Aldrovandia affinis]|uniref:Uncharacterized protein n=1 Tax=Aldrovandia affinis TaxID=143900 RepID=A0AAD7TBI6_9TELE|nr:hypothetical protein AAFF_G00227080 [Aldrovandia affinis]